MLSRKFLSLSLAVGLAVGASSGAFADNESLGGVALESCAPRNVASVNPCVEELTQALAIPGCRLMFADALQQCALQFQGYVTLAIRTYCAMLKYEQNLDKITRDFQHLYASDLDFQRAVDAAWSINLNTGRQCASHILSPEQRASHILALRKCASHILSPEQRASHIL